MNSTITDPLSQSNRAQLTSSAHNNVHKECRNDVVVVANVSLAAFSLVGRDRESQTVLPTMHFTSSSSRLADTLAVWKFVSS